MDDIVVSHYCVHRALAALDADRAWGIWSVEIGLVRDHRSDEVGHLSARTALWADVALAVEEMSGVDDVHGV